MKFHVKQTFNNKLSGLALVAVSTLSLASMNTVSAKDIQNLSSNKTSSSISPDNIKSYALSMATALDYASRHVQAVEQMNYEQPVLKTLPRVLEHQEVSLRKAVSHWYVINEHLSVQDAREKSQNEWNASRNAMETEVNKVTQQKHYTNPDDLAFAVLLSSQNHIIHDFVVSSKNRQEAIIKVLVSQHNDVLNNNIVDAIPNEQAEQVLRNDLAEKYATIPNVSAKDAKDLAKFDWNNAEMAVDNDLKDSGAKFLNDVNSVGTNSYPIEASKTNNETKPKNTKFKM